jgi:hypothetical protein
LVQTNDGDGKQSLHVDFLTPPTSQAQKREDIRRIWRSRTQCSCALEDILVFGTELVDTGKTCEETWAELISHTEGKTIILLAGMFDSSAYIAECLFQAESFKATRCELLVELTLFTPTREEILALLEQKKRSTSNVIQLNAAA